MLAFRPDTHPLIYATAGLLIAMGAWHIQTLWRAILLRKYFKKMKRAAEDVPRTINVTTDKLLETPDLSDFVLGSVTENTTQHLKETQKRSS